MIEKENTMLLDDFKKIIDQKKKENPFWFEDTPDNLATDNNIQIIEDDLEALLPDSYKGFIKEYGGGYFGFTNIFSADQNGDWYIVDKNINAQFYLPQNFIAISDDETGGLYGYVVVDGKCKEEVYYWDGHEDTLSKAYDNVFDYLVKVGVTKSE